MRKNLVLIVNQYAGINQHNRHTPIPGTWKKIEDYTIDTLKKYFELDINVTEFGVHHFKHATRKKAKEYLHQETIYAFVGGDDSLDYGITTLIKKKRKLKDSLFKVAYIPAGEGMAAKYALGLNSLEDTLQHIILEQSTKIDILNMNNERLGLYAGQGIFARAVYEREKTNISGIKGFLMPSIKAYVSSIFQGYKRLFTLKTNNQVRKIEKDTIGVLFSKIIHIGGGLPLIPSAKLNDGLMHIVCYGPFGIIHQDTAEEIYCTKDHTIYGGDYQGIMSLNVTVEKQAIDMILNMEELLRRKSILQ